MAHLAQDVGDDLGAEGEEELGVLDDQAPDVDLLLDEVLVHQHVLPHAREQHQLVLAIQLQHRYKSHGR